MSGYQETVTPWTLPAEAPARRGRRIRGAVAHQSGIAAELAVERHYGLRGQPLVARRWRGRGGEIDLVVRDGPVTVFVEVKAGRCHDRALARVGPRQVARIMTAAEEYVGKTPTGSLTEMRFDVATVDGSGTVRILENAFCA